MTNTKAISRDRWLDTLSVVAMILVVLFHAFPFAALELLFPSMGVMFALAGSLTVRSWDRSGARTIRTRMRRLLPPVWAMGFLLLPLMNRIGWEERPGWSLLLWVFPIATPPSNEAGFAAAGVLWFLVTYLWLVLLSPLLLKLYRRARLYSLLLPLALLAVFTLRPGMLAAPAEEVVQNVLTYAACWMAGFAHREGDLAKLGMRLLLPVAGLFVAGALVWESLSAGRFDLTTNPVAYAFHSLGFVLVLLRCNPPMGWLGRWRPLDRFVSMVGNRATTVYLWHNAAITVAVGLIDPLRLWRLPNRAIEELAVFGIAVAFIAVAVLCLGWVEDIAARRRPRLSPFPRVRAPEPEPVAEPALTR